MKVYLGVDHNGVKVKNIIVNYLESKGIDVEVSSLVNSDTDDYPDFAIDVCKNVSNTDNLGILVCGTGIGMSIAANKYKGIRCARVVALSDAYTAKAHNGANVIALGSDIDSDEMLKIIDKFIETNSPSEERHLRRVEKIKKEEELW